MAPNLQRFRRRVLAMLDARTAALEALYSADPHTRGHKQATEAIRLKIAVMR
jgi:hypothetical protein